MSEHASIDQLRNLSLFFQRKEFQLLDQAGRQASVPLGVQREKVALGRVGQVDKVQERVAKICRYGPGFWAVFVK